MLSRAVLLAIKIFVLYCLMASSHGLCENPLHTSLLSQSPELIPESSSTSRDRKKKQQQPRQILSCTKCRERKVKCDRTKPCSACCARGLPNECHFILGEGTEFGPIQQSLELRRLRSENQRLKERLLASKVSLGDASEDEDESTGRPRQTARRAADRQKRYGAGDVTDSLYFGSPGLASVISDFANMQAMPRSLAFTMPRGADLYAGHNPMYPFPALWHATTATQELLRCLEPHDDLLNNIDTFASKAVGFAFPFLPENLSRKEVEHFIQDAGQNAVAYPDALALIFAGAALGIQLGGEHEDARHREDRLRRGDVFIAAVMQALRASSFLSRPTLWSLQALLIVGPYLTNSGRFLDAWSMFGLTIRLAQSLGLHRNPKYLNPVPDLRQCIIRSNTWWWMLHTDQLYSMTLGRPLGISGIGDCLPAEPLTTDPSVLRLGEFVDTLTILARQILSSSQLTDARIDLFTDKLISLWDTMPVTLQFNEGWSDPGKLLPDYPMCVTAAVQFCKIHSYIILLNRQRIETSQATFDYTSPSPRAQQSARSAHSAQWPLGLPGYPSHNVPRGRPIVIQSSHLLLGAFVYCSKRVPLALTDWTLAQQAFNACLIILLDALETGETAGIGKVNQAYEVFIRLDEDRVHQLAGFAVSRISEGLLRLRDAVNDDSKGSGSLDTDRSQTDVTMLDPVHGSDSDSASIRRVSTAGSIDSFDEPIMGSRSMFLLEDPGLQSTSVAPRATGPPPPPSPPPPIQLHPPSSQPVAQTLSKISSPDLSLDKRDHTQQALPQDGGFENMPPPVHQQHPSTQPIPPALQGSFKYGSSYVLGLPSRPVPRKDSVAGSIGQVVHSPMTVSNTVSTEPVTVRPYGPTSMQPSMLAPRESQHYGTGPTIQQQQPLAGSHTAQQQELQLREWGQDWQAAQVQQQQQQEEEQQQQGQVKPQTQMFPPHQPQ